MLPKPAAKKRRKEKDNEDGSKKKKRRKKDPNAPKRALSAFMRFQLAERKRMKEDGDQPSMAFQEVSKSIGEKWKRMSATEKEPYEAETRVDQERYKKQMIGYKSGGGQVEADVEESEGSDDDE